MTNLKLFHKVKVEARQRCPAEAYGVSTPHNGSDRATKDLGLWGSLAQKKLLLLLLLSANVRCSNIDYKNPKTGAALALAPNESFEVKLRGLSEPNKFQAILQYKGNSPQSWTVVRRSGQNSTQQKLTSFTFANTNKSENLNANSDTDLQSGETYTYLIGQTINGEFQAAAAQTIEVPEDVVITGTMTLNPDIKERLQKPFRLYFLKDSTLKTNGEDLDLEVEEIYSEGGRLQTFSEADHAELGHDGKPSGHIHLKADKLTGPLTIEIRGERGGEGFKGATGPQGPTGLPSQQYEVEYGGISQREICTRAKYNPPSDSPCFGKSYEWCLWHYHPGVGGKGGTGLQGYQGLPGFKGGDVQKSEIEIPILPDTQIIFEAGAKGPGGKGGDGGPGGPGGRGSSYRNNPPGQPCDPPPQGPPGDQGPEGPRGPDGLPGHKETLTLNGVLQ